MHGYSCPVQKSSLDLESTTAILADVLVLAPLQSELLKPLYLILQSLLQDLVGLKFQATLQNFAARVGS